MLVGNYKCIVRDSDELTLDVFGNEVVFEINNFLDDEFHSVYLTKEQVKQLIKDLQEVL